MTEQRFNPDGEESKGLSGLGFVLAIGGAAFAYWWMSREVEEVVVSEAEEGDAEPPTSEQSSAPPRMLPRFQPVLPHMLLSKRQGDDDAVHFGPLDTSPEGRRI